MHDAEARGFEPLVPFLVLQFSRLLPSTARPRFQFNFLSVRSERIELPLPVPKTGALSIKLRAQFLCCSVNCEFRQSEEGEMGACFSSTGRSEVPFITLGFWIPRMSRIVGATSERRPWTSFCSRIISSARFSR